MPDSLRASEHALRSWRLARERTPMMASGTCRTSRSDIGAQLTGSFTYVDQRFMKERQVVSITAKVRPSPSRRQTAVGTPN